MILEKKDDYTFKKTYSLIYKRRFNLFGFFIALPHINVFEFNFPYELKDFLEKNLFNSMTFNLSIKTYSDDRGELSQLLAYRKTTAYEGTIIKEVNEGRLVCTKQILIDTYGSFFKGSIDDTSS